MPTFPILLVTETRSVSSNQATAGLAAGVRNLCFLETTLLLVGYLARPLTLIFLLYVSYFGSMDFGRICVRSSRQARYVVCLIVQYDFYLSLRLLKSAANNPIALQNFDGNVVLPDALVAKWNTERK
jgi:hypothetical protein